VIFFFSLISFSIAYEVASPLLVNKKNDIQMNATSMKTNIKGDEKVFENSRGHF
jgi:hypothetical protein